MTAVREVVLFAADHVLTVVWLKATLLALAVLLLRRPMARCSAAGRSAVWTLGAAGLLLMAPLQHLLPPAALTLFGFPTFLFRISVTDLAHWSGAAGAPVSGWAADAPLAAWIGGVWMAGAAALLARFAWQLLLVVRLARAAEPVDETVVERLAPRADRRAVARLRVAYSSALASPLTFGWRSPVILLPLEARGWSAAWRSAALAHEMAHVRRRDYGVLVLVEIIRALYWLNPLVWRLARDTRAELERACDDAVLRAGVSPHEYARHLLDLARRPARPAAAALPMVRRSCFRARVRAILDDAADRTPASRRLLAAASALWIAMVPALAAAALWACDAASR